MPSDGRCCGTKENVADVEEAIDHVGNATTFALPNAPAKRISSNAPIYWTERRAHVVLVKVLHSGDTVLT